MLEIGFQMWYNHSQEYKRPANVLSNIFLLSKVNTIAIIQEARLAIRTFSNVATLAGHPNANRASFYFGPNATENAPIVGLQPYGAFERKSRC